MNSRCMSLARRPVPPLERLGEAERLLEQAQKVLKNDVLYMAEEPSLSSKKKEQLRFRRRCTKAFACVAMAVELRKRAVILKNDHNSQEESEEAELDRLVALLSRSAVFMTLAQPGKFGTLHVPSSHVMVGSMMLDSGELPGLP